MPVRAKTDEGPATGSRALTVHLPSPDGATLFQKRAWGARTAARQAFSREKVDLSVRAKTDEGLVTGSRALRAGDHRSPLRPQDIDSRRGDLQSPACNSEQGSNSPSSDLAPLGHLPPREGLGGARTAARHAFSREKVDCGVSRKTDEGLATGSKTQTVPHQSALRLPASPRGSLRGTNGEAAFGAQVRCVEKATKATKVVETIIMYIYYLVSLVSLVSLFTSKRKCQFIKLLSGLKQLSRGALPFAAVQSKAES